MSGNIATLDFMGLAVDWNGNDTMSIYEPLAGDTGLASIICVPDCGTGDTYTLDYSGHTAFSPKSGIPFLIHLEGTIMVMMVADVILPVSIFRAGVLPGTVFPIFLWVEILRIFCRTQVRQSLAARQPVMLETALHWII